MQLLALDNPCEETLTAVTRALTNAGLEVARSFDLQSAMSLMQVGSCPGHGKTLCDCEYMVLLVYGHSCAPATLILHGRGRRSWVAMSQLPDDAELKSAIIRSLGSDKLSICG